jgi:hypothetical protein
MGQTDHFFVRITRRGRSDARYGWEICRQDNSVVVESSTKTFATLAQALIASAKAAGLLAFPLTVDQLSLRHQPRESGKGEKALLKKPSKARAKGH